jgi:5'(3')-deoxyribonucleotidase
LKPVFLLDVDGVLADFIGGFLNEIHRFTGKRFDASVITRPRIEHCDFYVELETNHPGLTAKIHREIELPGWAHRLVPYFGAKDLVRELHELGDVFAVTSPWHGPHWAHERTEWCWQHLGIPHNHVIHAKRKHLVFGHLFVDDTTNHVAEWSEHWVDHGQHVFKPLLWDTLYNRDAEPFYGERVNSYAAIVEAAKAIS